MISSKVHGFTLLEVLMVLGIASLTMAAGFQMVDSLRLSDESMKRLSAENARLSVQQRWLRELLESAVAVDTGGASLSTATAGSFAAGPSLESSLNRGNVSERFVASAQKIRGLSIASITSPTGVPIVFEIELKKNPKNPNGPLLLMYQDELGAPAIELGQFAQGTAFEYQDFNSEWGNVWPAAFGTPVALPRAIRLLEPISADEVALSNEPIELDPNKRNLRGVRSMLFVPQTTALLRGRISL